MKGVVIMLQVIGIVRKQGNYNGVDFDNTFLHCIREASTDRENGQICEVIKVKTSSIHTFPSIGSNIKVYYNRFGQVETYDII